MLTTTLTQIAARADLVLLTAEMFRYPRPADIARGNAWFQLPWSEYSELIKLAGLDTVIGEDVLPAEAQAASGFAQVDPTQAPGLMQALEEVYGFANAADLEAWQDEYGRLFEGSQLCPINQASYIRRDKGAILGDLAGFYSAFGWKNNPERGERPDHLVAQLEFVGMLFAMAAQTNDEQQVAVVHDALAQFAREHMHDWLPSVCLRLIETTNLAYYGAVAQWLTIIWMQLTQAHSWPIDRIDSTLQSPQLDPEDPYECGAPDLVNLSVE